MLIHRALTAAIAAVAMALFFCSSGSDARMNDRTVKIDSGFIQGKLSGEVLSFKGIPYAAPPIGDLRWRPPQPVKSWKGVRRATTYGNDCVQFPLPGDAGASGSTRGEDCLVLNVWRPATIKPGKKPPVMVWIHGGGFLNGAASVPFFDGSRFAREGIVLVGINYRLGRLGFFAHPALSAENARPLANYALLDQLAALRWVQRNIGAFGGDPNQVSVVGESAGGISVIHLLTWPAARGLFHRAAVMSGGGRSYIVQHRRLQEPTGTLPSAEDSGVAFGQSVGITDTGKAGLKALRALPATKINGEMSMAALLTKPAGYVGGPVDEGDVVTAQPQQNILRGNVVRVPLIVGTVGDDLPGDYPPDRTRPLDFFGADGEAARRLYDPQGKLSADRLASLVAVDMTMHEPARFVARQLTAGGAPVWLYRFDYVADALRPKVASAAHAGELSFLFDQMRARYGKSVTARDQAVAKTFHRYFVNFVKSGDPNGPGLPEWPKFDASRFDLMLFQNDGKAKMQPDPWRERLALVERQQDARAGASLEAAPPDRSLAGTAWQLVKFQSGDGTTLIPEDKAKYTLAFSGDGRVAVRLDCNRGVGTWRSSGPNLLQFGPLALTRALCPPPSMGERIARDWLYIRTYLLKDGRLFASLMADGGIYEFEPLAAASSKSSRS
ncbi:carboxylesterase family protein [Gloeobacter morelensis]|uniref:Carboxylic ester hydrolase n=1 Tax=Gloeobacter morelensis MG652769 TaxID=2781736 RepID=A0ABY3PKZ9_9CYAN|nr:carboxylesterase family protein [Gloeobacter morelensis]UFP94311.1 carboxylesterase family protein [Gloeobacter morelensis MG652769]